MNLESFREFVIIKYENISTSDIDYLLTEVLNIPRLELFFNYKRELTTKECELLDEYLCRRVENEPLQYILKEAAFRDYIFNVGDGVLIPRPETEMLVDLALDLLPPNGSVCDLGTGSGAIAISIALEATNSEVTAVDISDKALQYTKANKEKYNLQNLKIVKSDLFSQLGNQKFHIITANLPYVSQALYNNLDNEVLNYEPELALLSGNDGLDLIRIATKKALDHLYPNGSIILEFSPEQATKMVTILEELKYNDVKIINDLTNRARFAVAQISATISTIN